MTPPRSVAFGQAVCIARDAGRRPVRDRHGGGPGAAAPAPTAVLLPPVLRPSLGAVGAWSWRSARQAHPARLQRIAGCAREPRHPARSRERQDRRRLPGAPTSRRSRPPSSVIRRAACSCARRISRTRSTRHQRRCMHAVRWNRATPPACLTCTLYLHACFRTPAAEARPYPCGRAISRATRSSL